MHTKHFIQLGKCLVSVEEIVRLEAHSNYTIIHFYNQKSIMTSKILALYEKSLLQEGFIRSHHKHLLNPNYITNIFLQSNSIKMKDNTIISISRRKRKEVIMRLSVNMDLCVGN